jgi:cytochrome P450
VYNQVVNTGEFDKQTIYRDAMTIMFGGHETTSKSLCNSLYQVKKNPDVEKKLMKELKETFLENGKYTVKDLKNILSREKLDQLDYLTCFVKEVLRHDPPAARSLGYKSKRMFKVNDLLVPKNQVVLFNLFACHYDQKQWKEPMKFIPERFDASSDYFLTPEGKTRHPLAFCPFTFGTRTCPGRALGMMELKVLIIYYLLTLDYEIDQKVLDDPDVCYAILSPFSLDIKITGVHA